MTDNHDHDTLHTMETPDDDLSQADPTEGGAHSAHPSADGVSQTHPDTFPRAYVEQLRQENGKYRLRAERSDDLAKRLHAAQVAATGRLADPTDLPYDETLLDDPASLTAAIDALLATKPHLASRRPTGNVGQGLSEHPTTVSLANILRAGAN